MNNRERAEKILYLINQDPTRGKWGDIINAQLDEAVREALDNMAWGNLEKAAYDKGYAAAREQAAKAVEFQVGTSLETAFDRALVDGAISVIRAMVPASSVPGPQEEYSHETAFSEAAKLVEAQKMTGDDLYTLPDHQVRATVNAMLDTVVTLLRAKAAEGK